MAGHIFRHVQGHVSGVFRPGLLPSVPASASWSPTQLFAAGEQGAWYDPNDFATLFQDTAGTTPVTAAGQAVAKMLDKSGNGNHVTQSIAANRPVLRLDSSVNKYYLEFDGSNDTMASASLDLSAYNSATLWATVAAEAADTTLRTIFGVSDGYANTGSFSFGTREGGLIIYRRGNGSFGARETHASVTSGATNVAVTSVDFSGTTHATENATWRFNSRSTTLTDYGSTNTGTGNFGTFPFTIGSGLGAFKGKLYGLLVRLTTSTQDEIENGESWCRGVGGLDIVNVNFTPTSFTDSTPTISRSGYLETSAYASLDFTTTATQIEVDFYNTTWADYAIRSVTGIGIIVDNVYVAASQATANAVTTTARFMLASGTKTISVVNGFQAYSATPLGSFVTAIRANAALTQTNLTPTNRVAIYGDSISVGAFASPVHSKAWGLQVRRAYYPDSIAFEGQSSRSLYDDANTALLRAALVAKFVDLAPDRIWLAIGTNDYGLNKWSAASFGTAYAALLDDIHTALPSTTIFAQTPIVRTTETANGSGSTLGDYRSQISTAVSTRTSYCTLVDGTAIMTTASLTDGVHPGTAGHDLYAAYVISTLGI